MLKLTVKGEERWDEEKEVFIPAMKEHTLQLEHSLLSISKWEAIYHKPFLSTDLNKDMIVDYIKCMTINPAPDEVYENITPGQIKALERWLLDSGMSPNYTALLMRSMRALINRINQRGCELFKDVRTQRCQTVKRAVDELVIKRLRTMKLDNPKEDQARNIFLFCFYGMGIPLIDAAMLKKTQLKNGHISYRRQKTGRLVTIAVGPELEQLIKHLSQNDSAYLLPILTSADRTETQRQYRRFYQRYMRALRKLSVGLNSECHLTSYTPRHSWASIAYKNGIDINVIARALGHANTNITYLYIKEINDTQLECANRLVMQALL